MTTPSGSIFDKAINIGIYNDKAIISYYADSGLKHRTIKLDALVEAFLATSVVHKTPFMPDNCIRYMKAGGQETFIMYFPPTEKDIRFNIGTTVKTFEKCKLPARIWILSYKNDAYSTSKGFITKCANKFELDEDTILYKNIFPNVYSDCKICWGYNGTRSFAKPILGDAIDYSFFNSEFNTDLANTDYYRRAGIEGNVESFLNLLKTEATYPETLYVNSGYQLRSIIQ